VVSLQNRIATRDPAVNSSFLSGRNRIGLQLNTIVLTTPSQNHRISLVFLSGHAIDRTALNC